MLYVTSFSVWGLTKRSHCSAAQLRTLAINHRPLFFSSNPGIKDKTHKSNVYNRCAQTTQLQSRCAGGGKKTSWEDFNTSYPWREPESAQFHRVIWSPVGAYTPTQQHEHGEQKTNTLRVGFKQPAKYCSWNRLHVQHQHLSSYSIHRW